MHSLIPVTYIVANIMSGALRLPIAKMLDLWGRAQGFMVLIAMAIVGLIMMAACQNVQTFAAAQVRNTSHVYLVGDIN
jgi:MFS family permease